MESGQLAILVAAITTGLGGIAVAVRWGLGRIAKAFDDMSTSFNKMAEKHEGEERELLKLGSTVAESRADARDALLAAREARDVVVERVGRRTGPRPATSPGS
jgi:hypothetical protein